MNQQKNNEFINGMADLFAKSARTPILRHPDQYGMVYEEVFFPSMDGVTLEGWFMPADSDRLVICNHCMPANRYGYRGHEQAPERIRAHPRDDSLATRHRGRIRGASDGKSWNRERRRTVRHGPLQSNGLPSQRAVADRICQSGNCADNGCAGPQRLHDQTVARARDIRQHLCHGQEALLD